jgi:hypothetical protein
MSVGSKVPAITLFEGTPGECVAPSRILAVGRKKGPRHVDTFWGAAACPTQRAHHELRGPCTQ